MYIALTDTQHVYKVALRPKNELVYYFIKHALWTGLQFKYHFIYHSHYTREGNKEYWCTGFQWQEWTSLNRGKTKICITAQSIWHEWQQFTWTKPESSWLWSMQFMSTVYLSSLKVRWPLTFHEEDHKDWVVSPPTWQNTDLVILHRFAWSMDLNYYTVASY